MRVTVNGLAAIVRGVLLRESIMSDLADLVGGEEADRFGRLGSKFKASGPTAVEGVRNAIGDAPSGHDAGWWVSRISKARRSGSGEEGLIAALRGYLDALEAATSKRKERKVTMDSEVITGQFVDPQGTPFEVMIPITHAGSVRCSDRVGGSTWCTAARGDSEHFDDYAEGNVLFVLGPLLTNPESGKAEAIQIAADVDDLQEGELSVDEVMWANQETPAPRLEEVLRAYGLKPKDLVKLYQKNASRMEEVRLGEALMNDPRRLMFPGGKFDDEGTYMVSRLKGSDVNPRASIGMVDNLLLESCNLSGLTFPEMLFRRVAFESCDLRNVRFHPGVFRDCSFTNCKLDGAVFSGCEMSDVTFYYGSFAGTDFTTSLATGVRFQGPFKNFEPKGNPEQPFKPGSRWSRTDKVQWVRS
jgi:hypothetical protein